MKRAIVNCVPITTNSPHQPCALDQCTVRRSPLFDVRHIVFFNNAVQEQLFLHLVQQLTLMKRGADAWIAELRRYDSNIKSTLRFDRCIGNG